MKKLMVIVIMISVLLSISSFCSACDKTNDDNVGNTNGDDIGNANGDNVANTVKLNLGGSEGLIYSLLPDGTYEVAIGATEDKNIGIPSMHDSVAVTQVKKEGFKGSNITSVVLPDSLIKVDDFAFSGCNMLKIVTNYSNASASINVASNASINEIMTAAEETEGYFGNNSFSDCSDLEELYIPEGVVVIGTSCVQNGTNLKKVVMPNTVKYIYGAAFEGCDNIEEFVFSDNIEFLGSGAFYNTKWLSTHEDGCVYVGKCLYQYKGEVPSEITVREGTVEISTEFCSSYYPELTYGLSNLITVNCNAELERIGSKAFQGCANLEFVNFAGTAPEIGFMAFSGTKYIA